MGHWQSMGAQHLYWSQALPSPPVPTWSAVLWRYQQSAFLQFGSFPAVPSARTLQRLQECLACISVSREVGGVELAWERCSFDQQRKRLWREVFTQDCAHLGPAWGQVYGWGFEVTHEWLHATSSFHQWRFQGRGLDWYGQVCLRPLHASYWLKGSRRGNLRRAHM